MSNGALPNDRHKPLGSVYEVKKKIFSAEISQDSLCNLDHKPLVLLANRNQAGLWLQLRVSALAIRRSGHIQVEPEEVAEIVHEGGGALTIKGPIVYEHCGDEIKYYQTAFDALVRVAIPRRFEDRSFLPGKVGFVPKSTSGLLVPPTNQ